MANTNLSNKVAGQREQFLLSRLAVGSIANNRKFISNFALVEMLPRAGFLGRQRRAVSVARPVQDAVPASGAAAGPSADGASALASRCGAAGSPVEHAEIKAAAPSGTGRMRFSS